jgi:hypothetical protein
MATMTHSPDPPVAPSAPLAVDTANIGPTLRRTRKRALTATLVALALLVGVIAGWIALDDMYLDRQSLLDRTTGQIDAVHEDGGDSNSGDVDLHYLWSGETLDANVSVSDAGDWFSGEPVTVLVDPERDFVTLPGENYKPEWLDAVAFLSGFALLWALVASAVWLTRTERKLSRAEASAWRTVTVVFVEPRGEKGEISVVYLPEYAADRIWLVAGRVPDDATRAQVAGQRSGLVLRTSEDADLMLARPNPLKLPTTVSVAAYELREDRVGLRLESGRATTYVVGHRARLSSDVDTLEAVRAATMRSAPKNVVLLKLGLSRQMCAFSRITSRAARKQWPGLVERA